MLFYKKKKSDLNRTLFKDRQQLHGGVVWMSRDGILAMFASNTRQPISTFPQMRCLSCLTWTVSNGTVLGPRFPELFFGVTSTFPPDLRNFARFSRKKILNMRILFSLYDAQDAHFRVWDTATCVDCVWHSNSCWQNNNFISDVLKTMRTFKTSELLLLWSLRCTHFCGYIRVKPPTT